MNRLEQLSLVQKKAILSVVKAYERSNEINFDREMNRRFEEMVNGTVKSYSLEESMSRARAAYTCLAK